MVVVTRFAPPDVGIIHEQPATKVFIDQTEIGTGTLYITEQALLWGAGGQGRSLSLLYPRVTLHAVQREPIPCLYLQVDYELRLSSFTDGGFADADENDDDDFDPDEPVMTELRFVPSDEGSLSALFEAMSHCQTLHPDPLDPMDESEEDDIEEDAEDEEEEEFLDALDVHPSPGDDTTRRLQRLNLQNTNGHTHTDEADDSDQFADN